MTTRSAADVWNLGDYQKLAFENVIVGERLCAALAIPAGARVLDVGCGTGNTTLAAARRRAAVTGIDIASGLIARGQQRAEAEGLTGIDFQVGDAGSLPFADASFDYVLSTFGAVFLHDQQAAARELARVVRPGGTIALTAWARQSLPSDVYHMIHGLVPPPADAPLPAYVWTDGPRAAELLGPYCSAIVIGHHDVDACFPSADAMFDNHAQNYGPVMNGMSRFTADQRVAFRAGFIEILGRYNRATDGTLIARYDYATIVATRAGGHGLTQER
ncbi:MAG TPA: methyltransferase domain-containing protein [Sphingomonas sp.]|jgi:SAM-dependent methyltransferase|uniref:class I SAM-dependent methyltransferase n=1 Tax=Sphingomonas sp. TaxID=28214 RepID=UPI002EDA634B